MLTTDMVLVHFAIPYHDFHEQCLEQLAMRKPEQAPGITPTLLCTVEQQPEWLASRSALDKARHLMHVHWGHLAVWLINACVLERVRQICNISVQQVHVRCVDAHEHVGGAVTQRATEAVKLFRIHRRTYDTGSWVAHAVAISIPLESKRPEGAKALGAFGQGCRVNLCP